MAVEPAGASQGERAKYTAVASFDGSIAAAPAAQVQSTRLSASVSLSRGPSTELEVLGCVRTLGSAFGNVACVVLIAWGTKMHWVLGCVICALYTAALGAAARRARGFERSELVVLALAGLFCTLTYVPYNLLACPPQPPAAWPEAPSWSAAHYITTNGSSNVRAWVDDVTNERDERPSWVLAADGSALVFSGEGAPSASSDDAALGEDEAFLLRTAPLAAPARVLSSAGPLLSPTCFCELDGRGVFALARLPRPVATGAQPHGALAPRTPLRSLVHIDGTVATPLPLRGPGGELAEPTTLAAIDGALWIKATGRATGAHGRRLRAHGARTHPPQAAGSAHPAAPPAAAEEGAESEYEPADDGMLAKDESLVAWAARAAKRDVLLIFESDGTASGTRLRSAPEERAPAAGASGVELGGARDARRCSTRSALGGVLGAAVVPYAAASAHVAFRATPRAPAAAANLYSALVLMLGLVLMLCSAHADGHLVSRLWAWDVSLTAVSLGALLVSAHVLRRAPQPPSESVQVGVSWVANTAALGYAYGVHMLLDLPPRDEPWRWAAYNAAGLVLLCCALATRRAVPLVLAASTLVLDAYRIVELVLDAVTTALGGSAGVLVRTGALLCVSGATIFGALRLASRRDALYAGFERLIAACADGGDASEPTRLPLA